MRILCDSPWEGGRGYTPTEVGELTLDEVMMLLTDRKLLQDGKGHRKQQMSATTASMMAEDGKLRGRDKDGNPMVARIAGVSKARRLMEAAKARREAEQKNKPSKRELKRRKAKG